ncbi:hypothetical protein EVAR_87760_1 [Eumeta japonica]|uniref:Uncharacterized protein n=1 Tax=Eumeta variegata TaxID=151549 RepID=A0A4C1TGX1_EUMVA|nr:hypothetical protein EVAR_87760_1 [Eumeta japonica]
MNSRITNTTYWTDSKTVLSWINADPRSFKPFVAHRLAEIEETSSAKNWRWVPSKDNVADDATRDPPNEFSSEHRWFKEYIDENRRRRNRRTARRAVEGSRTSFNCSAIDYFGPMIVTVGRRTEKRWGVLITCLTTRRSSRDSSQSHAVVRHTRTPSLHGATRHADRDVLRQRDQLHQRN